MRTTRAAQWRAILLGLLTAAACDHPVTTGVVSATSHLRLAVSYSAVSLSTPVQKIRLTAQVNGITVATRDTVVNPNASQWAVSIDIDPSKGRDVVVLIELLNTENGEQVVWSGRTAVIHVTPGRESGVATVELIAGPINNAGITAVHVTPHSATVPEGTQTTLSASFDGGAAGAVAVWESLDPSIATVNGNGVVNALLPGSARIKAAAGSKADTATITVTVKPVRIVVTPGNAELTSFGETATFAASVQDTRGAVVPGATVTWTSSNNTALESQGAGKFVARRNASTVTVTATLAGGTLTGTATAVVAQRVSALSLSPGTPSVKAGEKTTITATATDARNNTMSAPVTWSSSDQSVATIDANGVISGLKAGNATITATAPVGGTAPASQTVSATATLRVEPPASSYPDVQGNYTLTGTVNGEPNSEISGEIVISNQVEGHASMVITIAAFDLSQNKAELIMLNQPGTITVDAQGHLTGSMTNADGTLNFSGPWVVGVLTASWTAASPKIDNPTHTLTGSFTARKQ